ncbi:putative Bracovirus protein MdBV-1-25 [Microplitis demolitor]
MITDCKYHDNKLNNYCARDNVKNMGQWLLRKTFRKIEPSRDKYAVLDFTGYRNDINDFIIKELSVYCLNKTKIIKNELIVLSSVYSWSYLSNFVKSNYNIFYNTYGIKWKDGNFNAVNINAKLSQILLDNGVRLVFVTKDEQKNILQRLIDSSFKIICLEDFQYVESNRMGVKNNCGYHTHEEESKNNCVRDSVMLMVNWVLKKELFKSEVTDRFGPSSQLKSQEYDDSVDDLGLDVDVDLTGFDLKSIEPTSFDIEELELLLSDDMDKQDIKAAPGVSHSNVESILNTSDTLGDDDSFPVEVDDSMIFELEHIEPYIFSDDELERLLNDI